MPTFDGGHYFLTCLVPVRTDANGADSAGTSPVHALRKQLALLPPAAQTPGAVAGQSPFSRNARTHFARFVVIDDVAYNGRDLRDALWSVATRQTLTLAQPQDHLTCPFLLFAVDFDAASGAAQERDAYLAELWAAAGPELRAVFRFCEGFQATVRDGASFAGYLARAQLETTMSFNDYYAEPPTLPSWSTGPFLWAGIAAGAALAIGVVASAALFIVALFAPPPIDALRAAVAVAVLGAVALALVAAAAYASVIAAGGKPFPAAPDSDLPTVLKALHLQRSLTRFAIENQTFAAGKDAASAQQLYDAFSTFLAASRPGELGAATQPPGVIGL